MHKAKCRELEDLRTEHSTAEHQLGDLERGRDTFRSQYLELREINKELSMKVKAQQKSLNGHSRTMG